MRAGWRALARFAGVALACALVAVALDFVLHDLSLAELEPALLRQPAGRVVACLVLTVASFACLALYDLVGVHVAAPGRIRARLALLAGAPRPAGAELFQAATGADPAWHALLGVALEGLLLAWLWWLSRGPREIALGRWRLPMPPAALALMLMLLGAVESGTAIGALYVLLPGDLAPPFDVFAVGCIAAVILGVVSHAPGGLGVFEASMTAILAGRGRPDLLAALLLYRLVYNLLPFALAVLALGLRSGLKSCAGRSAAHKRSGA